MNSDSTILLFYSLRIFFRWKISDMYAKILISLFLPSKLSFFVANSFGLHHNSRLSCGRMALICFKTKAFLALKKIDIKGYKITTRLLKKYSWLCCYDLWGLVFFLVNQTLDWNVHVLLSRVYLDFILILPKFYTDQNCTQDLKSV